jgi:maleamate amidohydrolase
MNDDEFFAERGFGGTMGFGERSALLVIDIIRAFTDPDLPLGADLGLQIEATNRLIEDFERRNEPIFFTTVRYDLPDLADAGIWPLKQSGLKSLANSTGGAELDPRLGSSAAPTIIVKKYASSFFGTDLSTRLVAQRIDTLVLSGCTTSGCVRATAVDALQNGFRPIVVRDAVGDRSEAAHRQSLFDMQAKYADVVSLGEALARRT